MLTDPARAAGEHRRGRARQAGGQGSSGKPSWRRRDPEERGRRRAHVTLLREIKADTPVHRLWAGSKLLAVAALSITLSYFPSWAAIGITSLLLAVTAAIARIPKGAWPRLPRWFWITLAVGALLTLMAGGPPYVRLGHYGVGLGGVDAYCRFVAVGAALILWAAMVGWTTPLGDIAPAVSRLLWPLRKLRLPVDEWAVTLALCVRSLPLLVVELRVLVAARRLRPPPPRTSEDVLHRWLEEPVDLLVTALASALRRAGELAEAISARGGTGAIAARVKGPRRADAVALALVAAFCAGAIIAS
jgi:energy-coupling factor transport system permease protein